MSEEKPTALTFADHNESTCAGDFKVVAIASLASLFEWFDFFVYGCLATVIGRNFFSNVDDMSAFLLALLAFSAGFAVRPFGALVFGFLGDLWGRKHTFLITLIVMDAATCGVSLLPTYHELGAVAPWTLVILRILQGLSVGGMYGGSATYVAEHVPKNYRGFYTSLVQTAPTIGMALSLFVTFAVRTLVGDSDFGIWGWRIPLLLSSMLLGITVAIQVRLSESPIYLQMKAAGRTSLHPWFDAFGNWRNLRMVFIALFGAMIGQGVIWYTAQFYVLFFLERVLKVDSALTNLLLATALCVSAPLYIFFGWISDRVGRRPLILAACLLAALTYFPIFKALAYVANPALAQAVTTAPVTVLADSRECSFLFDPIGEAPFSTSCDIVRSYLARTGIAYSTLEADSGTIATLNVGNTSLPAFRGEHLSHAELSIRRAAWEKEAEAIVAAKGYPASADSRTLNIFMVLLLLIALMSLAAMVYGPMAAMLCELFPARVRYTSMSLPYHLGSGWFGAVVPTVTFAIVAATGNIYSGLWYPFCACLLTFFVGLGFLPETKDRDLRA